MAKPGPLVIDHEDAFSAMATWWKAVFLTPAWAFLAIMPVGVLVRTAVPDLFLYFYAGIILSGIAYLARDMLKRRILIDDKKITFAFMRLPLSDLQEIQLINHNPGYMTAAYPKGLLLVFRNGKGVRKDIELMLSRLKNDDLQLLIETIGRRVAHCRIDPAVEKEMRRKCPVQIMQLENPDKLEVPYHSARLLNELPEIMIKTAHSWARVVGPLGTLLLCTPLWMIFNLRLFEALRDYTSVSANSQFYLQLVKFLTEWGAFIDHCKTLGMDASGAVSASPVVTALCFICLPVVYFYVTKASIGANKLTIDSNEISLDRFFSMISFTAQAAKWENISSVQLSQAKASADPKKALIKFKDKDDKTLVTIKLDALSQTDREKVSIGLAKFAHCRVDTKLTEALEPRQDKSYTELWLKSLSDTPGRKNLEPLRSGHMLENKRYEIDRKLAVGGEGVAYLGRDLRSLNEEGWAQTVVLKETLIPPFVDKQVQQAALERFEREARLLKELKSEHVVGLRDYFIEDHRCYLVLEYVQGKNLRQFVTASGAAPQNIVLDLAKQMAEMLAFLHNQKQPVIHRDFTPDNLIRQEDGRLKLIDFNVARETDDGKTGTIVGKHAFVPPEQFRGKPTKQSDIYAYGATLYFLLIGRDPVPISKSDPAKDIDAQIKINPALCALVRDCTELDLSKRIASIEEIVERLQTINLAADQLNKEPAH